MRRLLCFLAMFFIAFPAFAEGEVPSANITPAAVSYVTGAYNDLNSNKQDKLTTTNVVESGSGAMVTGVAASNGTVTVTKSEVTIPVGSTTSTTRAAIWLQ